jgi:hypothetical protein
VSLCVFNAMDESIFNRNKKIRALEGISEIDFEG